MIYESYKANFTNEQMHIENDVTTNSTLETPYKPNENQYSA